MFNLVDAIKKIFIEQSNVNKTLKKGTVFLYQIFPSSICYFHDLFMRAIQEKNLDVVQRLLDFYQTAQPQFIDLKERTGAGNSALHVAAKNGFFDILLCLLENYADINIQNKDGNTPLYLAADSNHKSCVKLLIEFGADVNVKNTKNQTVLTEFESKEIKEVINGMWYLCLDVFC